MNRRQPNVKRLKCAAGRITGGYAVVSPHKQVLCYPYSRAREASGLPRGRHGYVAMKDD